MPTVYEAKKLECRQAFNFQWKESNHNPGHLMQDWTFPRCSASACGHWRVLRTTESKKLDRTYWQPPYEAKDEEERHSLWNAYVNSHLEDGWKFQSSGNATKVKLGLNEVYCYLSVIRLSRELPANEVVGECGLIAHIEI